MSAAEFLNSVFGGTRKDDSGNQNDNQNDNQNSNQNSNQNDNNNQSNNQNNNKNNIDNNASIWDNKAVDNNSGDDNNQNDNQNSNQNSANQNGKSPSDALKEHMESLNIGKNLDVAKIQEDLRNGDTESLTGAFKQIGQDTYLAAMSQMNTLVDAKLDAVKETMRESNEATNASRQAVTDMEDALPYTKNPDIATVAKAALANQLKNGLSTTDAIKKVDAFFRSTAEQVTGMKSNAGNKPGTGNFSDNNFQDTNTSDSKESPQSHEEWMDLLIQ